MVKFKALIFFGISLATVVGIFLIFPETFDVNNPASELALFIDNPTQHWWAGFAMFSLFTAGLGVYISSRRTAPSFLAFWFLISFVLVLLGALMFTQSGVAAHQQAHDVFWNAINLGEVKPLLGVILGPVMVFAFINAAPVYFMIGNSTTKAVSGVEVLPTGDLYTSGRHRRNKQRVKPVKLKKRKRK